jgi:hypothetical protein
VEREWRRCPGGFFWCAAVSHNSDKFCGHCNTDDWHRDSVRDWIDREHSIVGEFEFRDDDGNRMNFFDTIDRLRHSPPRHHIEVHRAGDDGAPESSDETARPGWTELDRAIARRLFADAFELVEVLDRKGRRRGKPPRLAERDLSERAIARDLGCSRAKVRDVRDRILAEQSSRDYSEDELDDEDFRPEPPARTIHEAVLRAAIRALERGLVSVEDLWPVRRAEKTPKKV